MRLRKIKRYLTAFGLVDGQKNQILILPSIKFQKIFGQSILQLYLPKKHRDGRYKTSWRMVDYVCYIRNCANYFFNLDQGIFLDDSSMVAHCFC